MKKALFISSLLLLLLSGKLFSQTVYVNQSGSKFHTKACKLYTKNFEPVPLWKARDVYRMRPCDLCHPPTKDAPAGGKKKPVKPKPKPAPAKK